jgi:hypothetical protein
MEWLGFWIFLSTLLICDTYLFAKGYRSIFWAAKTPAEKKLQEKAQNNEQ